MTFTELVTDAAERMNLTSPTAIARVGRSINERYRWLASSLGLQTTARATATATATIGNRALTFGPTPVRVEKLYDVFDATVTPPRRLLPIAFEDMRTRVVGTDPPDSYAVQVVGADSVTIRLNTIPATAFVLTADVLKNVVVLAAADVPNFPEDFHTLLVYGAMAIELEKMEKYEMAKSQEARCQQRIADLRFFLAKNAFHSNYQGKTTGQAV